MHDPMTVAHEIKWPISFKKNSISGAKYYNPLITIWHVDPEKDGTDDSCGWFKRAHHGDQALLERIKKDFAFEFQYWFNESGYPLLSTIALSVDMYSKAVWAVFKFNRCKHRVFMRKYLYDIIHFAENHVDSLLPAITMKYGVESRESRVRHFAEIIYGDILRKITPWYKHPRWHIHHWKIQFHPWQQFKRRYFDKCCMCGKRGFRGAAMGDWNGTKLWHPECDNSRVKPVSE
jgi:hypothetical protein